MKIVGNSELCKDCLCKLFAYREKSSIDSRAVVPTRLNFSLSNFHRDQVKSCTALTIW